MAVTVSPLSSHLASNIITDSDADETAEDDVLGTTCTIYFVQIDNTANSAASYLKIYDNASPTVGTTVPDHVYVCPASVSREWVMPQGIPIGTALSFACLTAGGTAGTTGPTSAVTVRIVTG